MIQRLQAFETTELPAQLHPQIFLNSALHHPNSVSIGALWPQSFVLLSENDANHLIIYLFVALLNSSSARSHCPSTPPILTPAPSALPSTVSGRRMTHEEENLARPRATLVGRTLHRGLCRGSRRDIPYAQACTPRFPYARLQ